MPAADATFAAMLLNATAGNAGWTATVGGLNLRLMVNAPTAAVPGTELSATGYSAGGLACTFSAAATTASGAIMSNSASITWTNSGVVAWLLTGWELWDNSTPTKIRKLFGLWNNQPLTVGPGTPFTVAIGGLSISVP